MYIEQILRRKGFEYFIGIDEAGRGPLAGPVVACAVFLDSLKTLPKLDDSKKLSPSKRQSLFDVISTSALYQTSVVDHKQIDKLNIYVASHKAFMFSLSAILKEIKADLKKTAIIVDGPSFIYKDRFRNVFCYKGADQNSKSCQAASIIAKVTRDRIMGDYALQFPEYDFGVHKGYPTRGHRERIRKHGPCQIHRRSFKLL